MRKAPIEPTPMDTPCRAWRGRKSEDGYGYRWGARKSNMRYKKVMLHRWVWEQINGPVPAGMIVMHACDNPPCFRYDHLKLGTIAENNADRKAKGRNANTWGENNPCARLTWDQVAEIRRLLALGCGPTAVTRLAGFDVGRRTVTDIRDGKRWTRHE